MCIYKLGWDVSQKNAIFSREECKLKCTIKSYYLIIEIIFWLNRLVRISISQCYFVYINENIY